jgi:hypothetical protein
MVVSKTTLRLEGVLTLENRTTPTNWIRHIALSFQHIDRVPECKVIPPIRVLCEYFFKLLRDISALVIIRSRISSMFRPVHVLEIYPEQRVGQPSIRSWVREVDVYDKGCDNGQQDAEAEAVEPNEGVIRRHHAVAVLVEEVAMLLQHRLVCVFLGPAVGERAEGAFGRRRDVDACGTCYS